MAENVVNKKDVIDAIAEEIQASKSEVTRTVESFLESIVASLKQGKQVSIPGFGIFSVKERAAREGRNPKTGETIQIAASQAPHFKAGKAFKDAVNCEPAHAE